MYKIEALETLIGLWAYMIIPYVRACIKKNEREKKFKTMVSEILSIKVHV